MKKRLFQTSLLLATLGLILLGSLRGVLGSEFAAAPNDLMTGDPEWRLLVGGAVSRPLNLTFDELAAMPRTTVFAELWCVTGVDTFLVTAGSWTGVRLELILAEAEFSQQAISVDFYAKDGYTSTLGIGSAWRQDVILAYELDGNPLPETLRLVVPGTPGWLWIHNIISIKLFNAPPSIESCDSNGLEKDVFNLTDTVFIKGNGFEPSQTYNLHFVHKRELIDRDPILIRISNTAITVTSDSSGNISPTAVWIAPLTFGNYSIIVDVNGNGKYDQLIDAYDNNHVQVPGKIIPEFSPILFLVLFVVATLLLVIHFRVKRKRSSQTF